MTPLPIPYRIGASNRSPRINLTNPALCPLPQDKFLAIRLWDPLPPILVKSSLATFKLDRVQGKICRPRFIKTVHLLHTNIFFFRFKRTNNTTIFHSGHKTYAKAPFIATQLNSTRRRVELSCELSRFGHPLRRTTPIADGRWAARSQSVLSRSVRSLRCL